MSQARVRRRAAPLLVACVALAAAHACTNWDGVKTSYCSHFDAGDGDCDAGVDGGYDAGPVGTYDGGPPVTWVMVRGGIQNDDLSSFAIDAPGVELAISGEFANAIDFGDGGNVLAQANVAKFVARYRTSDAALIDGHAFRCGTNPFSRTELPLVYADGGLVMGATCSASPATVLDQSGAVVALDGGPTNTGPEVFLFKYGASGPVLQYLNTPINDYTPSKGFVALARSNQPEFLMAANLPLGSEFLGLDAGAADGGQMPVLARLRVSDFTPEIVDVFDCTETPIVQWESMTTDPSGNDVYALINASTNLVQSCVVYIPNTFTGGGSLMSLPGTYRWLWSLTAAGSARKNSITNQGFGFVPPDGGTLRLVSDSAESVYFFGKVYGGVLNDTFTQPTLVVGHWDHTTGQVTALQGFRGGPTSDIAINDVAVLPGASPAIWVTGKVRGQLETIDGGFILASNESTNADGFLMRLDPSTLAPTSKKFVFGNLGIAEEGRRVVLRPPDLYVAGTVTSTTAGPYVFGGKSTALIGGQDILLFKMPIPP